MAPEEGERISQPGKDGTIFVLDLSHIDGQHAAEALECRNTRKWKSYYDSGRTTCSICWCCNLRTGSRAGSG